MVFFALIALPAACTRHMPSRTASVSGPEIQWDNFRWRGAMFGTRVVQKAALQVPIRIDSAPDNLFLQLDTGSDGTMFYEVPYREIRQALPASLPRFVLESARIGRTDASRDTFWMRPKSGRPINATGARTVGTLGADFIRHRTLVLDFPQSRFAFVERGVALPQWMEANAHWTVLTFRNGKIFVRATIDGVERDDVFFDSGSSAFALIVRREWWTTLTGRSPADSTNDSYMASSWGRDVELVGAPLRNPVTIAGIQFANATAFHHRPTEGVPNFFETSPYPLSGYFGNVMFADRYIVIVDIPRSRFGLMLSSDAARHRGAVP
jgi:hypothetical protein